MELAANGVGDTLVSYLVARPHESVNRVSWVPRDPPFEERFAFGTKVNGVLSPATRQFMVLAHRGVAGQRVVVARGLRARRTRPVSHQTRKEVNGCVAGAAAFSIANVPRRLVVATRSGV
jgi:hypothetical protein